MPKPAQGRIIAVEVADPQGRNVKIRTAVIVSATTEIEAEQRIFCVAITGTFPEKAPPNCILLPWHRNGHPRTGLKKRCVAMCSWIFEIKEEDIRKYVGTTPRKQLDEILAVLNHLE